MKKQTQDIQAEQVVITSVCHQLKDRAFAAELLGMEQLCVDLMSMATRLSGANNRIKDALNGIHDERYKSAQQSTANMIKACLAVASEKTPEAAKKTAELGLALFPGSDPSESSE